MVVAAMVLAGPGSCRAAEASEPEAVESLVERLIVLVRENYVLEVRLEAIDSRLRAGLADGRYEGHVSPTSLSSLLTDDLRAASDDLHFGVRPIPEGAPSGATGGATGPQQRSATAPSGGTGLGGVTVLEGNVGFLEIRSFADPRVAGSAVDAAFRRLAGTDALILDLRASRGGRPETVAYLMSYLFDGEPFVFNRFHWRNSGKLLELRTEADLPAPRYTGRDVFALTSRETPSAAEGFAYHLRQFERATLVGERTAGAAHTYQLFTLADLQVAIPTGRPISPVSGGNWQGTGVEPDHQVPAGEALAVAHRLARGKLAD